MSQDSFRSLQEALNQVYDNQQDYGGYDYDSEKPVVNIKESHINQMMENAMGRVFYGQLDEVETKETREGTKYKVRVKDAKTGSSYIRFATREKIGELRANPNISSVELTDEIPSNSNSQGTTGRRQVFAASPNKNKASYRVQGINK